MNNDEKTAEKKNTIGQVAAAGIAGAAVGAAVVLLSDKNNRKKVEKSVDDLQKWGDKTVNEMQEKAGDMADRTNQALQKVQQKSEGLDAEKLTDTAGKKISKAV